MAKNEDAYKACTEKMDEIGIHYHEDLLNEIINYLGDRVNDKDDALVACSDKKELEGVKKEFLIGKLGLEDGDHLEDAMERVCETLGTSNRTKHRATFYYILVGMFNKESVFIKHQEVPISAQANF